jgi:hypothetical protein
MNGPRKTLNDRIAEEEKRQDDLRLAIADLKARARILDRKLDTRRKIVLGAAVQAHAKRDSAFLEVLAKVVRVAVIREQDRALLPEFFPSPPLAPSPPARPLKSPREPPSGAAPA